MMEGKEVVVFASNGDEFANKLIALMRGDKNPKLGFIVEKEPMKKVYILKYDWTGGQRSIQYDSIYEFTFALDQALLSEHTIVSSINIETKEIPA